MSRLQLRNVSLAYDGAPPVIDGLSLTVGPREFVTVLGASGSGKTSLLKLAAGFVAPASGDILIDGQEVTGPGAGRAVVFQDDALFPWLTAIDNVALALKLRGEPAHVRLPKAGALLKQLGLAGFEARRIWELSGGQRQRVGLARALISEPSFLLMDEPFGALDALTRTQMHAVVLRLWDELQPGILFITHDVEEALLLGTRVIVLGRGGAIRHDSALGFGARAVRGEPQRSIRSDPEFVRLREEVLDLVVDTRAAA